MNVCHGTLLSNEMKILFLQEMIEIKFTTCIFYVRVVSVGNTVLKWDVYSQILNISLLCIANISRIFCDKVKIDMY